MESGQLILQEGTECGMQYLVPQTGSLHSPVNREQTALQQPLRIRWGFLDCQKHPNSKFQSVANRLAYFYHLQLTSNLSHLLAFCLRFPMFLRRQKIID